MVSFPGPDKTRPALVLTRTRIIGRLSFVTVAPITRTIRGISSEVRIGTESGLKIVSVANLDAVQTVPKSWLGRFLGSFPRARKDEVRGALLHAFELDRE